MVEQGIDQSAIRVARCRVDHQSRRLVDDQQMLVLEGDGQRNVLRLVVCGRWLGNGKAEALVAADLRSWVSQRLPGDFDGAASNQRLEPLARQGRNRCGKRTVEAPARVGRLQANFDRL